ncbi:MAG: hypothetical protein A2231_12260 [Candidatus Firestonebacteria bacterium RIFOXYA2_FULL_40_8]|nr:MAG: hypothetical protein A2231_12260 [Candidatus Firestonebacteria bacterium RIFOXYA2_FULL_40_8]
MKICLINPPQILKEQFGAPFVFQPLGLLYVAAALEKEHDVSVIDATLEDWRNLRKAGDKYYMGLNFNRLKERILELNPDIVGISIPFSVNFESAAGVAAAVKAADKNILVIAGGVHPTVKPKETLECKNIDIIVLGEGEITLPELLKEVKKGKSGNYGKVKGIGYKTAGKTVLTPERKSFEELDELPCPARHLVDMEEYFNALSERKGARDMYTYSYRAVSIMTSRGCPFGCNFCSIHLTMGRRFRARTPENIIAEIKEVITKYKVKHINFEDDNITFDRKRAKELFDLMIENKFDITWSAPNGIRADTLDEELVIKMKASGCKRVFVAPESGVQRVVDKIIGKKMDLKKIEEAVILLKKHDIIVDGSFVIGFPGETKNDIKNTVKFALKLKKLGMSAAGFHIATPYYGTKLYEEAEKNGFLREDLQNGMFSTTESLIETKDWSLAEIKQLRDYADVRVNQGFKKSISVFLEKKYPILYAVLKFPFVLFYQSRRFIRFFVPSGRIFRNALVTFIERKRKKLPKIKYIVFEVTDACNSRCQHCSIWKFKPKKNILTVEEIRKLLAEDIFESLKTVLLTGGEAVIRKDIKEIISAIHEVRPEAEISLSTNGLLPERVLEVVNYALEQNIVINVGVSLDAVGERHDTVRGVKGNFKKVDYLLRELVTIRNRDRSKMGAVLVGHTISNLTSDSLLEVYDYANKLDIGFITQLYEEFSFYHNEGEKDGVQPANYNKQYLKDLVKQLRKLPPSFHNEILIYALKHKLKYKCDSLRSFFLLHSDGTVSPCLRFSHLSSGSVKTETLTELWKSKETCGIRGTVDACKGCSNSWATDWSYDAWFLSFWRIKLSLLLRKLLFKFKKVLS